MTNTNTQSVTIVCDFVVSSTLLRKGWNYVFTHIGTNMSLEHLWRQTVLEGMRWGLTKKCCSGDSILHKISIKAYYNLFHLRILNVTCWRVSTSSTAPGGPPTPSRRTSGARARRGGWRRTAAPPVCGARPASSPAVTRWLVLCSAPLVPQPVVQSQRRPLLGPSPGRKRQLPLSHLRHYDYAKWVFTSR